MAHHRQSHLIKEYTPKQQRARGRKGTDHALSAAIAAKDLKLVADTFATNAAHAVAESPAKIQTEKTCSAPSSGTDLLAYLGWGDDCGGNCD